MSAYLHDKNFSAENSPRMDTCRFLAVNTLRWTANLPLQTTPHCFTLLPDNLKLLMKNARRRKFTESCVFRLLDAASRHLKSRVVYVISRDSSLIWRHSPTVPVGKRFSFVSSRRPPICFSTVCWRQPISEQQTWVCDRELSHASHKPPFDVQTSLSSHRVSASELLKTFGFKNL